MTRGHAVATRRNRTARRTALATGILVLAVFPGGCGILGDERDGQQVEAVMGGGTSTDAGAPATERRIEGKVVDLVAGPDGPVLVTETDGSPRWWRLTADGKLSGAALDESTAAQANQAAVGPDGDLYLTDGNAVWRVGRDDRPVRLTAASASEFAPDGTPIGKVSPFDVSGLAVGPDGTVYYSEDLDSPAGTSVVRAVRGGAVQTVIGRRNPAASDDQLDTEVRAARNPQPGTPATAVTISGKGEKHLAVAADGTVYVRVASSILARGPDGTVRAVVPGGASPELPATPGDKPFTDPHPAAALGQTMASTDPPATEDIAVDVRAGDLFLQTATTAEATPAYRWTGELSKNQRSIARLAVEDDDRRTVVWRVRRDGTAVAAARGANALAVQDGCLYLATQYPLDPQSTNPEVLVVRIKLPR